MSTESGKDSLTLGILDHRTLIKINEDRKSCEATLLNLKRKISTLNSQVELKEDEISAYITKEKSYESDRNSLE